MKILSNTNKLLIWTITFSFILISGCANPRIEREIRSIETTELQKANDDYPFIKLHTKNGGVYILKNWAIDSNQKTVRGSGKFLNNNREVVSEDSFAVAYNDIVIAETNLIHGSRGLTALEILTVISVAGSITCISVPKACFGSCPTFYADNGSGMEIQAEGFSSSVLPCLEATDIDALYNLKPNSKTLQLQLKNEAYETHVIRSADIIAVPRSKDTRVFISPQGKFIEAKNITEPIQATGQEGDISEKICSFDNNERFSAADSFDLSAKEIIELNFNNTSKNKKGLIIAARQTLLTTFLFYQTLAYMGKDAGKWFAELELSSTGTQKQIKLPGNMLGYMEVLMQDSSGEWIKIDETGETGPIATDIKIIPLTSGVESDYLKVRLRMTKGLWRIDYAALADIGSEITPVIIHPEETFPKERNGSDVVGLLTNPDSVLTTYPGDKYFLHYSLPDNYNSYEYFLQSRGYYLEWMRDYWMAEENKEKIYQMLLSPGKYLKDLAPEFKKIEAEMESNFWSSKYVNP